MNIPENTFRNYHKVIGGNYKDFWHVCLEYIVPDHMSNGTIVNLYFVDEELLDLEEEDQWKLTLIREWNQLYCSITGGPESDSGISVHFYW